MKRQQKATKGNTNLRKCICYCQAPSEMHLLLPGTFGSPSATARNPSQPTSNSCKPSAPDNHVLWMPDFLPSLACSECAFLAFETSCMHVQHPNRVYLNNLRAKGKGLFGARKKEAIRGTIGTRSSSDANKQRGWPPRTNTHTLATLLLPFTTRRSLFWHYGSMIGDEARGLVPCIISSTTSESSSAPGISLLS
jgi:hypothetical protein